MAKKPKKVVLDPAIFGSIDTIRQDVRSRESAASADVGALFAGLFDDYSDSVSAYFQRKHKKRKPKPKADAPDVSDPTWDAAAAKAEGVDDDFTDSFLALTAAANGEASTMLEGHLTDAYMSGFTSQLWMLQQLGVDVLGKPPSRLTADLITPLVIAAGFGGVSYAARLDTWAVVYTNKVQKSLTVSTLGEATLSDTLDGLKRVFGQYQNAVEGLAGNELQRAYSQGSTAALDEYRSQVDGEVWVTRRDKLVCELCFPLEGMITHFQPVDDTHPGCRCIKVPTRMNSEGQSIEYGDFVNSLNDTYGEAA